MSAPPVRDVRFGLRQISDIAVAALKDYAAEVRGGKFPDADHSYGMKPEEEEKLRKLVAARR